MPLSINGLKGTTDPASAGHVACLHNSRLKIAKVLWIVVGYMIGTCGALASTPMPGVKIDQSLVKCTITSNFGSAIQTVNLKVETVIQGDKTLAGSKVRTWLPIGTLNDLRANPVLVCVVSRDRNNAVVVREVWCPPHMTAADGNPDKESPKAPRIEKK